MPVDKLKVVKKDESVWVPEKEKGVWNLICFDYR